MNLGVNSNEDIVRKINEVLNSKKNCVVNIVNDKLTLSVFSLLEKNLKNVKEINIRGEGDQIGNHKISCEIFCK